MFIMTMNFYEGKTYQQEMPLQHKAPVTVTFVGSRKAHHS